jgi:hypothetical protein
MTVGLFGLFRLECVAALAGDAPVRVSGSLVPDSADTVALTLWQKSPILLSFCDGGRRNRLAKMPPAF